MRFSYALAIVSTLYCLSWFGAGDPEPWAVLLMALAFYAICALLWLGEHKQARRRQRVRT